MQTNSISITIPNPTASQLEAIRNILGTTTTDETETTTKRTTKPAKTVSDDEDDETTDDELAADSDEDTDTNEDDETDGVTFEECRTALNKYGNKNPDGAQKLLASFGVKSTRELAALPKKWEPIHTKIMSKMKKK